MVLFEPELSGCASDCCHDIVINHNAPLGALWSSVLAGVSASAHQQQDGSCTKGVAGADLRQWPPMRVDIIGCRETGIGDPQPGPLRVMGRGRQFQCQGFPERVEEGVVVSLMAE